MNWVLIVTVWSYGPYQTPANLGRYATLADCQAVARHIQAVARHITANTPVRFSYSTCLRVKPLTDGATHDR